MAQQSYGSESNIFRDYFKVTTKVSKKRLSFNVGLWKFVPEQLEIFEHEYFLLQKFPKCFWLGRKNDFPSTSTLEVQPILLSQHYQSLRLPEGEFL